MKYISQTMDFISYKDGETPTVEISKDGYWVINGVTSTVKAEGETPTVEISDDGYWVINGNKTSVKAEGSAGTSITAAYPRYYLSTSNQKQDAPADTESGWETDFDEVFKSFYAKKAEEEKKPEDQRQTWYIWSQDVHELSDNTCQYSTPTVNSANSVIVNWCDINDKTLIDGAHIATGTIDAKSIKADTISALNLEVGKNVAMGSNARISWNNIDDKDGVATTDDVNKAKTDAVDSAVSAVEGKGYQTSSQVKTEISESKIRTDQIEVTDLNAFGATIGGWEIAEDMLRKDSTALVANNKATYQSLINSNSKSPVRLTIGGTFVSEVIEASIETEDDGMIDHDILYTVGASTELLSYTMLECRDADNNVLNNEDFMLIVDDNEILVYRAGSSEYVRSVITFKLRVEYNRGGSPFKVLEDGSLYASASEMKGNINASGGTIGGWKIEEGGLYADNNTVGLSSDNTDGVRFYAGLEKYLPKGGYVKLNKADLTATTLDDGWTRYSGFMFDEYGEPIGCANYPLQSIAGSRLDVFDVVVAELRFKGFDMSITDVYSAQIRNASVVYDSTTNKVEVASFECEWLHDDSYIIFDLHYYTDDMANANFRVLEDGSLYAEAADIKGTIHATDGEFSGTINATGGTIGGLKIDNGIKGNEDGEETFSLTKNGLTVNSDLAKIQVGNFQTYYDKNAKNTYWQTDGPLKIQGMESKQAITSIELMTQRGTNNITATTSLYARRHESNISWWIRVDASSSLYYPKTYTIYYQGGSQTFGGIEWKEQISSITLSTNDDGHSVEVPSCTHIRFGTSLQALQSAASCYFSEFVDGSEQKIFDIETITQTSTKNDIVLMGNLIPKTPNTYTLGRSNEAWSGIFTQTGAVGVSDRNEKNSIYSLSDVHTQIFDALKPVSYKFNENTSNRTHTGLIAQDVKEAVENAGLTTQDFAGYCEWKNDDGSIGCGLRYSEFISLCIDQIQKLKKRVEELEDKLNNTK